jgi:hypothetical protein
MVLRWNICRSEVAKPRAKQSVNVPDSNVLYIPVFLPNLRYQPLETLGKCLGLGLEVVPSVLPLTISSIINVLPVVVYDQGGYLDPIAIESIQGI